MLDLLFMFCAGVGGAIMVVQFVLMLMGITDELDGDMDLGEVDADFDTDFDADTDHPNTVSEAADADIDNPGGSLLFRVLSVRGVIAALAFFGLGGWWARAGGMGAAPSIGLGVVLGVVAMYSLYWIMQQLYRLRASGTVNIANARGADATVYVPVPPGGEGKGKVHVVVQGRTMEYEAVTEEAERLSTGEAVVVTQVVGTDLVRVARLKQPTQASA